MLQTKTKYYNTRIKDLEFQVQTDVLIFHRRKQPMVLLYQLLSVAMEVKTRDGVNQISLEEFILLRIRSSVLIFHGVQWRLETRFKSTNAMMVQINNGLEITLVERK